MKDYLVVLVTAIIGLVHAPWWAALPGGILLTSFVVLDQQQLRPRFNSVDSTDLLAIAGLAALPIGFGGAAAAFALGRATAWLFGF